MGKKKKRQVMEDERESLHFEANLANVKLLLRFLWRDRVIDVVTYWDFSRRVRKARATEDLREIARELVEISKARKREN